MRSLFLLPYSHPERDFGRAHSPQPSTKSSIATAFALLVGGSALLAGSESVEAQSNEPYACSVGGVVGGFRVDDGLSLIEGEVPLLFEPEDSGYSLGASWSCWISERMVMGFDIERKDLDDIQIDNALLSLSSRRALDENTDGIVGVLAGWSQLEWQRAPVATLERDPESERGAWGIQAGLIHEFAPRWEASFIYRYIDAAHRTQLQPRSGTAEYRHDGQQSVSLGIHWRF